MIRLETEKGLFMKMSEEFLPRLLQRTTSRSRVTDELLKNISVNVPSICLQF